MRNRSVFILLAVAVLAACAALPARAQFGAIEGDIKDEGGKPATGVNILIERTDIKGTYRLKDKDIKKGHYFHGGLPLGRYNITLLRGDQKIDFVQNVRVGLGDPTKVDFDLKSNKDRQLAASAGIQLQQQTQPGQAAPQLTKEQREQIEKTQKQREAQREKMEKLNKSFAAGMEALKTKNYDVAITELENAAQADPNQHVVFANLAQAYAESARTKRGEEAQAQYKKANDNYQKALTLKPDDADYRLNYALALASAGMMKEAQEETDKVAAADPTRGGRAYFNLGAVFTNTGKGKEAAEAFRKATTVDPNYAEAWYQLGVALMSDAKLDEKTGKITPAPGTTDALQKYLQLSPTGTNAESAKSLLETLGGSVQTQIKIERGKKKN